MNHLVRMFCMRDNLEVNLRKGKITGNWSHRETDSEKRGGYRHGMRNRKRVSAQTGATTKHRTEVNE